MELNAIALQNVPKLPRGQVSQIRQSVDAVQGDSLPWSFVTLWKQKNLCLLIIAKTFPKSLGTCLVESQVWNTAATKDPPKMTESSEEFYVRPQLVEKRCSEMLKQNRFLVVLQLPSSVLTGVQIH